MVEFDYQDVLCMGEAVDYRMLQTIEHNGEEED